MEAATLFTARRASMLQQSSSVACHSTWKLLEFARSLESLTGFSLVTTHGLPDLAMLTIATAANAQ
jgi:hypothetical protein